MEQIIITRKDGTTTYPLLSRQSCRNITSATQSFQLLGEDVIKMSVVSGTAIDFQIGDYITVFGRRYTLNRLPEMSKDGANTFEYNIEFEGVPYEMMRAIFELSISTTNNQLQDVQGDSLTGNLNRFATVLIANLNRVFPNTWELGTCPASTAEDTTLTFGETDNCLSVAQHLCDEFDVEMDITFNAATGKRVLNFASKVGTTLNYVFKYGRGRGLYQLNRRNVDSSNIITRLKVYGSTENITSKYRANRLCLPTKTKSTSYIENATAVGNYGLFEACKYFDDIKPTFNGQVTAIDAANVLKFTDSSMFDLNATDASGNTLYLLNGTPAKIHFNTGNLAGYEFEVSAYDHATHTFTLIAIRDEYDRLFPSTESAAFKIAVGDKYKILDVALPDAYVNAAESALQTAGQAYYDDHCQPRVKYALGVSRSFLEKMFPDESVITNVFHVGDYIRIVDTEIGVDKLIRIQSFNRDVLHPYDYDLSLSDTHETSLTATIIDDEIKHDKEIQVGKINNVKAIRQGWRANREILESVFDEDGDYYTEKIKPLSIETKYLSVGAKWSQFQLLNALFEPNYGGNPTSFHATACTLVHYAISDTEIKTWAIGAFSASVTDTGYYYLYAKCSKSAQTGVFLLSQSQFKADDDPNYYHFLVGILNGVDSLTESRMLSLSYGFSMINGRFITTGRIQSSDGNTYFDLDDGEIGGRIVFNRSGQDVTLEDLGDESKESKDFINNTLPGVFQDIYNQLDGQKEQFFEAYDPTMQNAPASTWTTTALKEKHLSDLFYNTLTGKIFRFIKENGVYRWQQLSDSEIAQALALANDALSLAGTKRRVFVVTPYPPYDIGDLWVDGTDIHRCRVAKASGESYSESDWIVPVAYDNTKTVIDGGIVTSGTVQLAGDDSNIKAGITGQGSDDMSVRIWAGATMPNRFNAPFRVLQNGEFWSNKAHISGSVSINGNGQDDDDEITISTNNVPKISISTKKFDTNILPNTYTFYGESDYIYCGAPGVEESENESSGAKILATFVKENAGDTVTIPRIRIELDGADGYAYSSYGECTLKLDGQVIATETMPCDTYHTIPTNNLSVGTHTISIEWEIYCEAQNWNSSHANFAATPESRQISVLPPQPSQKTTIGDNGMFLSLGGGFNLYAFVDNLNQPLIALVGRNASSQEVGIRITRSGLQIKRAGSDWTTL